MRYNTSLKNIKGWKITDRTTIANRITKKIDKIGEKDCKLWAVNLYEKIYKWENL